MAKRERSTGTSAAERTVKEKMVTAEDNTRKGKTADTSIVGVTKKK